MPEERTMVMGIAAPTLQGRVEALWSLLPLRRNDLGEKRPLVQILVPEKLTPLFERVLLSSIKHRHPTRRDQYAFHFSGIATPWSPTACNWLWRGPRRAALWLWYAKQYQWLWEHNLGELAPKPQLV